MSWLPFLLFIPLAWAVLRQKRRYCDGVTGAVAMGMALSMAFWPLVERAMLPPVLALVDLVVVAVLAKIVFIEMNAGERGWTDTAHRAQFIGLAGIAKVTVWLSVFHHGVAYAYGAWAINLLLLYQILVAGGVGHERIVGLGRSVAGAIRNRVFHGADTGVA